MTLEDIRINSSHLINIDDYTSFINKKYNKKYSWKTYLSSITTWKNHINYLANYPLRIHSKKHIDYLTAIKNRPKLYHIIQLENDSIWISKELLYLYVMTLDKKYFIDYYYNIKKIYNPYKYENYSIPTIKDKSKCNFKCKIVKTLKKLQPKLL